MNKKSESEIIELCKKMNIRSNAIIANQCGKQSRSMIDYNGHSILVINSPDVGVSKNRNLLLKNAIGTYAFFMDDDGIMNDDYKNIILKTFAETDCEWVKFNINIVEKAKRETNTLCLKKGIATYGMVSQYGMPGFAFAVNKDNQNFNFDETVGTPNYLFHGEDSLFIHSLFKKKKIYCSDQIIGSIIQNESSWFSTYDDQYYITQGYLYKKMHGGLAWLYVIRMYLKKRALFDASFSYIYKRAKIGFKLIKIDPKNHLEFVQKELKRL